MPTRSAPTRPGPDVTATAVRSFPETPASRRARSTIGRDRLHMGAAGQLRDDPAESGVQVDLAGDDRGAHRTGVVDHRRGRLVTRRLDGQQGAAHRISCSASAMACGGMAPSRSTDGSGPLTLTKRRGDVLELPTVDDQVDRGAETGHHLVRPTRRGRAVGIGARDDEHARLLQQQAQEVVVGNAHRHLGAPVQPGRPGQSRLESEGQGERSRPPASGQGLGCRGEGHAERADLAHRGGQDRKVHALGPPLHAVHRAAPRRSSSGRAANP